MSSSESIAGQIPSSQNENQTQRMTEKQNQVAGERREKKVSDFPKAAAVGQAAIILNRRWIEDVDKKYRDFKDGYNCYTVSNGEELAELLNNDVDTRKIVQHDKKLMERHIKADWER